MGGSTGHDFYIAILLESPEGGQDVFFYLIVIETEGFNKVVLPELGQACHVVLVRLLEVCLILLRAVDPRPQIALKLILEQGMGELFSQYRGDVDSQMKIDPFLFQTIKLPEERNIRG